MLTTARFGLNFNCLELRSGSMHGCTESHVLEFASISGRHAAVKLRLGLFQPDRHAVWLVTPTTASHVPWKVLVMQLSTMRTQTDGTQKVYVVTSALRIIRHYNGVRMDIHRR